MALMEELAWWYADDDDEIDQGWREMLLNIAFEIERLFRRSKHHYSEYGKYLYDFPEMIQINIITGDK
jgi:hypothetical protein